jgi:hypothetical protein
VRAAVRPQSDRAIGHVTGTAVLPCRRFRLPVPYGLGYLFCLRLSRFGGFLASPEGIDLSDQRLAGCGSARNIPARTLKHHKLPLAGGVQAGLRDPESDLAQRPSRLAAWACRATRCVGVQ